MSSVDYQVCFIQGDWLLPTVWDKFERHFRACGYVCSVLSIPAVDGVRWQQILHGDSRSSLMGRLVDFYAELIAAYPTPPILIGHALGGLVVQLLLDRGLGAAGVVIAPRPPQGVFPGAVSLMHVLTAKVESLHSIRFLSLTPAQFARRVAYPLSGRTICPLHKRLIGRVPQRLMAAAATGVGCRLHFNRERGPLLLVTGGDDRMVASTVVHANYLHQHRSLAPTHYICFPGYGHLILTQPGWEAVADRILTWLQHQLGWI
ncbi:alpha/beta hydrolase [Pseudomonas sp. G11-1]|nr:alpha/beta hydrolase [Pseudomonas sp. G11-1]MCO5789453.1 alpha/beta hydrolase [Pseudomonas sp. G11-2]